MNELVQLAETLEDDIFDFRIDTAMQKVSALTERVITTSSSIDSSLLSELTDIINHVNYALDNKDYLFLIDLLQFELIPFMESSTSSPREN